VASQSIDGLDDAQVARLRQQIIEGARPRVRVTGSQFPVSTIGTVVRVGDPDRDGGDFVAVRIKVGGVSDELRFSPNELSLARRGRAGAPPADAGVRASPQKDSESGVRASPRAGRPSVVQTAASSKGRSRKGAASGSATPTTPISVSPAEPARTKTASTARRAAAVPTVTITLASAGSSWSVSASRGARVTAKKVSVAPGVVTAIAALLNNHDVEEAVAAVNGAALGEAEARADKLRAELAEVEAILVSHQPPN
jgi:hypothetical protein